MVVGEARREGMEEEAPFFVLQARPVRLDEGDGGSVLYVFGGGGARLCPGDPRWGTEVGSSIRTSKIRVGRRGIETSRGSRNDAWREVKVAKRRAG